MSRPKRWTDAEVRDWLDWLAPTPKDQWASVGHLMKFHKEDGMTKADLAICRRAVRMLEASR
jgi:hypothetical protein